MIVQSVPHNDGQDIELLIGGLASEIHYMWVQDLALTIGDEIRVQILDSTHVDPAVTTYSDDAAKTQASKRQLYEQLRKEFEGR